MKRFLFAIVTLGTVGAATFGIVFKQVPELGEVFKDRGVSGTFVMFDPAADTMVVWNEERATQRFAPAATFRIVNALIALDAGAVTSIDEDVPYHRNQYRTYENIRPLIYGSRRKPASGGNRQMELRKQMRISNTPVFRALAREIGDKRMRAGIRNWLTETWKLETRSIGSGETGRC